MRETKTSEQARRFLTICNACRYCEGYCAVFPAMELRQQFSGGDLGYLANLCHDCRGCYFACPFTPPHEYALNLPQALGLLRGESYAEYAWPRAMGRAFSRNGTLVAMVTSLSIALVILLAAGGHSFSDSLGDGFAHSAVRAAPGAFYAVIPERIMSGTAVLALGFSLLALLMGFLNFWRDTGGGPVLQAKSLTSALGDVLTLRNLGGGESSGGHGCNDLDERFSQRRRYAHHAMFYGVLLCFASTSTAFLYERAFGLVAPYPFWSVPVLLGAAGGAGMVIGAAGLLWVKAARDQAPAAKALLGSDYAFILLWFMAAATGLLLLALRGTGAMSALLALHLGVILSLFLLLPYSKFVHSLYRSAALLRHRSENLAQSEGQPR